LNTICRITLEDRDGLTEVHCSGTKLGYTLLKSELGDYVYLSNLSMLNSQISYDVSSNMFNTSCMLGIPSSSAFYVPSLLRDAKHQKMNFFYCKARLVEIKSLSQCYYRKVTWLM
jgi:hypothetical protein